MRLSSNQKCCNSPISVIFLSNQYKSQVINRTEIREARVILFLWKPFWIFPKSSELFWKLLENPPLCPESALSPKSVLYRIYKTGEAALVSVSTNCLLSKWSSLISVSSICYRPDIDSTVYVSNVSLLWVLQISGSSD